ncbi:hypothetical protein JCGZ_08930 [Jatropha curcas]|uniref:non-specific serine/threonine protein kinase n=1 Tax=Jatropha curcas TaxID=180498 RepID=A0A067LEX4_JATCU|nr:hypothetical protein JCGZ_08930 [Jatropha curcas]
MSQSCSLYHIPALVCWCFCFFNSVTCFQNETDRLALISFKNATQQDPFQVLSSLNDSLHFCNWHGVFCSLRHPDRVIALNLNSQRLVGSLSPHIGNLSFLKRIDLNNNSFYGQIPQEMVHLHRLGYLILSNNSFSGKIPANLSSCSNLLVVDLNVNKLQGNIPSELGSLLKLEVLILGKNKLTGRIPPSIGNLSSLSLISLTTNELHGQTPEEISRLGSLRFFMFSENNLTGEIPQGLLNISSIDTLVVYGNQLHGSIPSNIGLTLPKLKVFLLGSNKFTGPIPISLLNASSLENFDLDSNHFTGPVPKDLGKLSDLQYIEFSYNQLEGDLGFIVSLTNCSNFKEMNVAFNFLRGSLPNSIANLSKELQVLTLTGNQFQGTIPSGVENLINLQILFFSGNYLTGPIHINFEKFQQLETLSLESNQLIGAIPSSIGNSSKLSRLSLAFNNLKGSIPPSLGNCHYLIQLDLSHNGLSGSIPKQVIGLSSLSVSLDLSANALSGSIPLEVGFLQNLVKLDLSHNKLSGTIPNTISKCSILEELHLEENSFEGKIPQEFSALRGLKKLDISQNNFSGEISDSLADLEELNYLNLSFNQFQGEVPKRGIFLNASAVSLQGNNRLCGGIAELKLPFCLSRNSENKVSFVLKVTIPVVVATFLSFLVCLLVIWYCKRKSRKMSLSIPSFQYQFLRISYAELFKATNGFSPEYIIGVGSYGSVYKGFLEQVGTEVAIKVLNLQRRGASNSFMSECQALKNIRHRNLLKLLSVCSSIDFEGNDFKALIYKFMANGSLEKWLHAQNGIEGESRYLKLIDRLNIAIDIATALEYLHNGSSTTIIHGDLKPSNVLLDEEMTAHIGDFGLAKIISTISDEVQPYQSNSSSTIKGSIGYIAPDYGMGGRMSIEGDVYSYGIILLEIFTGKKPTDDAFKDDLSLHTFVEGALPYRKMDIVDQRILSEEGRGSFEKDIIISILKIGVACSKEQPGERIEMPNAIAQLRKIKGNYLKARLKQERRNAYQIGGPSTSRH